MLGAVAMFYFYAAAAAMAIACAGPDMRAKFCSAYLMFAWGLTNRIALDAASADEALLQLSPWDIGAVAVIYILMMAWPARWTALMLAALTTQVIFQVWHAAQDPADSSIVAAHAANEAMYVVQLVSVTIPTLTKWGRLVRRRLKRSPRVRRPPPPPYDGWQPPEDYRSSVGGGEAR